MIIIEQLLLYIIIVAFCHNMEILLESLKLGIAPSLVVALYLTINKYIDSKKEEKQAKLNTSIVQSFNKLNTFLDYITKDLIEKENDKCTNSIKNAFQRMENSILKYSNHTIINNNIEINKKNIIDNIHHLINTEYYNLYNILLLYSTNKYDLVDYMDIKWKDELYDDITEIIFDKNFTKEQKIYNLQNKINIRITDYSVNLLNKYTEYER